MNEINYSKLWKAFITALGHMIIIGVFAFIFLFPFIAMIAFDCFWWFLLYPLGYLIITTLENYRSNI